MCVGGVLKGRKRESESEMNAFIHASMCMHVCSCSLSAFDLQNIQHESEWRQVPDY